MWWPGIPDNNPLPKNPNTVSAQSLSKFIKDKNVNQVRLLLDLGADPNGTDLLGLSVLTTALVLPVGYEKQQILTLLLQRGGNITQKVISDADFWYKKNGGKKILPGRTRKITNRKKNISI